MLSKKSLMIKYMMLTFLCFRHYPYKKYLKNLILILSTCTPNNSWWFNEVCYTRKNKKKISNQVNDIIKKEIHKDMNNISAFEKFKKDCEFSKDKFKNKILKYKNLGKRICGYAATAKVLQF